MGEDGRIADYFHLFAGTSTGGLIALSLTAPDPDLPGRPRVSGRELPALYVEDGPQIFHRSPWQRLVTPTASPAPSTRSRRWRKR